MRKIVTLLALAGLVWPHPADAICTKCTAEQVTTATAKKLLPGGSDAIGGIGDWYLSNDKIEAMIDDISTIDVDVAGGGTVSVDRTSSNAVATGGTVLDLGLRKKRNDQLPQFFNVGGASIDNVFLFRDGDETIWDAGNTENPCASVEGANSQCPADTGCAAITTYGIMLMPGVSTPDTPTLWVRTRYQACEGQQQLYVRSEVWNKSAETHALPILDVFLWASRALLPFAPSAGHGFTHPVLDLTDSLALVANFQATNGPYFAAPGNVDRKDGKMARGKPVKAVSYGYYSLGAKIDANGGDAGGTKTTLAPANSILGIHSDFLSIETIPQIQFGGGDVAAGQSIIFERYLVVGKKNDPHSVVSDARNPDNIMTKLYGLSGLGIVSGRVKPGSKNPGTVIFIRTGGGPLSPIIADNSPVTAVRTKGGFNNVLLPQGTYALHIIFPGRDEVTVQRCDGGGNDGLDCTGPSDCPGGTCGFNVGGSGVRKSFGAIDVPEKAGTLVLEVQDADTGQRIPAKLSFDPSPDMRRELVSYSFDLDTGMCSNDLVTECTLDSECGGGNTCFRTCSNVEPTKCTTTPECDTGAGEVCASDGRCRRNACSSDADCGPGNLCVADTEELDVASFAGGPGQGSVIYTNNGKVKERIKPGTYTIYVSRGPEYSVQKLVNKTITSKQKTDLGVVTLKRVVDTTGYMSADFHIHSGRSLDSSAPMEDRVRSFAGEGVNIMVATDHDINTDYTPIIKKLKLDAFITSIVGTEVTTSVSQPPNASNAWGHVNGWPQEYQINGRRNGSIEDEGVSPNVIFDRLRGSTCVGGDNDGQRCSVDSDCPSGTCEISALQCAGGKDAGQPCTTDDDCRDSTCTHVVVQYNHPRSGISGVVGIGVLNNIGFDPSAVITDCKSYPVLCSSNRCVGGSNEGNSCTIQADCPSGTCGCVGGSLPDVADGCNNILNDRNVIPQTTPCDTPSCGSGYENPNGTRNIDFDVMEIDNGGTGLFTGLRDIRRDWISLVNQGLKVGRDANDNPHPIWGTGVSDTHRIVAELPGYSRTFVRTADTPDTLNVRAFNDAVLAGHMLGSSGPYVTFTLDDGGTPVDIGDTLATTAAVNLNITVQAAPWIPVDEVRIIKNGCVFACYNTGTSPAVSSNPADPFEQTNANVERFNATIADTPTADSYYIVEASQDPDATALDATMSLVAKNAFPYAYTNPIFVDFDGGGYTGIGAPEPTCGALPPSCSTNASIQ